MSGSAAPPATAVSRPSAPPDGSAPQPAAVEVRAGRWLSVLVAEPLAAPSGRHVFLLHGGGGRAAQWRFVIPGLRAAGHRVIAWDAPGHGDSAAGRRWRDHAGEAFVQDALALVERFGAPAGGDLIAGHSYGARILLGVLLALARKGRLATFARAVLLAPPAPEAFRRPLPLSYLPVWLLERLRPRLSAGFRAVAWGPDADPALVEHEVAVADRNSLYVFKALLRQALPLDPAALATLTLPVDVLAGEADRLTPPDGARALAAALPQGRLTVLPRCGHQILMEQPAATLDAILGRGAAFPSAASP